MINLPQRQNKDVVFRRIGGRIVPIQAKKVKNDSSLKKAGLFGAAGAAIAAAGSEVASQLVKGAATLRQKAKIQFRSANVVLRGASQGGQMMFDLGGNAAKAAKSKKAAVALRGLAMVVRKARTPVLGFGALAGGFLIGKGIENAVESKTGKQFGLTGEGAAQVAGAAAGVLASTLYYKRLGLPFKTAASYGKAFRAGTVRNLPKIPIKTKYGQLRFKF